MNRKKKIAWITAILLALCLCAAGGFLAGKACGRKTAEKERDLLRTLNRSSIENMAIEKGPVLVIGHMAPDSDTVCSAIVYAELLTELGYPAEAVITAPVNRETAYILKEAGTEAPRMLDTAAGKDIFLVDHSEYAQALPGMEEAHIVGILDHHGVGTVTTGHQVVYEARPIGATATIVWLDYLNYGAELDRTSAFLLLGAVLSDTNGLTGTTTTEADRIAVEKLSAIAGVEDTGALYQALHREALSYEGMSGLDILFSDYKEYETNGVTYGIGLVNAIDEETAKKLAEQMKEVLPLGYASKEADLIYASVGIRENGEKIDFIVPGTEMSERVLKEAFPNYDEYDGTSYIFRTGLGRKTKFVPGLSDYLTAHEFP